MLLTDYQIQDLILELRAGYNEVETPIFRGSYFLGNYVRQNDGTLIYRFSGFAGDQQDNNSYNMTISQELVKEEITNYDVLEFLREISPYPVGTFVLPETEVFVISERLYFKGTYQDLIRTWSQNLNVAITLGSGDGLIHFNPTEIPDSRSEYTLSRENGLLGIPTRLFAGQFGYYGIRFISRINPEIRLGRVVTLRSRFINIENNFNVAQFNRALFEQTQLDEDIRVTIKQLTYSGDSRGTGEQSWIVEATAEIQRETV